MDKTRIVANTLFAILCAALINTKSFAEPVNLGQIKREVLAYHDSGAYEKELAQVIAQAQKYVVQRAEAEPNSTNKKLAIVLDIDETSLSNYEKMIARKFVDDSNIIHRDNLSANLPTIQPMLSLYHNALQHHVAVFFVTGRPQSEYKATEKNLKTAGYVDWNGLYLRPVNYSQTSITPFKLEARKLITAKGYTIIASIGDQQSDLHGGYADKTFKLPNPYYYIP